MVLPEVLVINVGVNAKQSLQNGFCNVHEILRKRHTCRQERKVVINHPPYHSITNLNCQFITVCEQSNKICVLCTLSYVEPNLCNDIMHKLKKGSS